MQKQRRSRNKNDIYDLDEKHFCLQGGHTGGSSTHWESVDPLRSPGWRTVMLFLLVQPRVGRQWGNPKDLLMHHKDISCGPPYIIIQLSFPPTYLRYQSPRTYGDFRLTQEQLEERTSQPKNRHLRQSLFFITFPLLSGALAVQSHPE